ncbi:hypothetical protein SEVIR_3G285466v4 [Setaria viridis]
MLQLHDFVLHTNSDKSGARKNIISNKKKILTDHLLRPFSHCHVVPTPPVIRTHPAALLTVSSPVSPFRPTATPPPPFSLYAPSPPSPSFLPPLRSPAHRLEEPPPDLAQGNRPTTPASPDWRSGSPARYFSDLKIPYYL